MSLTYTLELEGEVNVGGEATMHRWFDLEELPGRDRVGDDQADVIYALTSTLPLQSDSAGSAGRSADAEQLRS